MKRQLKQKKPFPPAQPKAVYGCFTLGDQEIELCIPLIDFKRFLKQQEAQGWKLS